MLAAATRALAADSPPLEPQQACHRDNRCTTQVGAGNSAAQHPTHEASPPPTTTTTPSSRRRNQHHPPLTKRPGGLKHATHSVHCAVTALSRTTTTLPSRFVPSGCHRPHPLSSFFESVSTASWDKFSNKTATASCDKLQHNSQLPRANNQANSPSQHHRH